MLERHWKRSASHFPALRKFIFPLLTLTPKLRTHIFHAKSLGDLIIGYDAMAKALADELRGLRKTKNLGDRVSRLLLASNDGSPRFYRQLAFLQERQGPRLLICRLAVDSLLMGNILGFKEQVVKAVLPEQKEIRGKRVEEPAVQFRRPYLILKVFSKINNVSRFI